MRFIRRKFAIFDPTKIRFFLEDNEKYADLIFAPHELRLRRGAKGGVEVWASTRRAWLVLTPEEEVRRRVVRHLMVRLAVPATHIIEEYPVRLNGQPQRADIVVVDMEMKPWLVVECKAPEVAINQSVIDQVVRYNSILGARQVVVTNGKVVAAYTRTESGLYERVDFPL